MRVICHCDINMKSATQALSEACINSGVRSDELAIAEVRNFGATSPPSTVPPQLSINTTDNLFCCRETHYNPSWTPGIPLN